MPEEIPFLDDAGHCILKVPGTCVYYSGSKLSGSNISNQMTFNEIVQKLVAYAGPITTTTTTTTTTSTTSTSTTSTTSTTHTTTSTTSTSTTSTTNTTTTTTTTSTTSTTTSTTTTTTTTGTTTSTTSTSTTTTTTTTLPSARIYWGAQVSGTPPNSAQVQAQLSSLQNPTGIVNVDWTSFNASPNFCWAAVPAIYPKTKWFDTGSNNGNIGGGSDLFTIVATVTVIGVSYSVYMTQFATQFAEATQLQP